MLTGEQLRDRGVQMVLLPLEDWAPMATRLCREFYWQAGPNGALFEDARQYAETRGLPRPPSPNAWGAIARNMAVEGTIVRTGRFRKSVSVRSHARMQPLWRLA
jgi:hypothetical protein